MVTTISRALAEDTAALARLDALDRQVADLARRLARPRRPTDDDGYRPRPAPAWWQLDPATSGRRPSRELRDWVEHVYRPGYGHLAALGPCWPQHDLCLYGLDIAQPAVVRPLPPARPQPPSLLSAQAEYQARILPAIAAQLAAETTRCGHPTVTAYPGARP